MKNILLFSILFLSTLKFQGQQQIFRYQDDMTDKVYHFSSGLMVTNEDKSEGFRLQLDIKETDDKTIASNGLTLKVVGIGNCFEKDNLIFLFENGQKISLTSWNDFNCEGDSWFYLNEGYTETYTDLLKVQKLVKIRFENGSSHESLTREISGNNQNYFIELFKLIAENKVTPYTGK
jgi:hypothetical protein